MQKQKREQYTAEFKAHIVKEILKEEKTVSQVSAEYGIHSSQLYKWCDQALAGLPSLFDDQSERALAEKSGFIRCLTTELQRRYTVQGGIKHFMLRFQSY